MKVKNFKDTLFWYSRNALQYSESIESRHSPDQLDQFASYLKKNSLVLDAGCAAGRDSAQLANRGLRVVGLDISDKLLDIAKKNHPNLNFVKGDFRKLPFGDEHFDGIWAHASLVHFDKVSDIKKSLSEFYRVLKKGGIIHVFVKKMTGKKFASVTDNLSEGERFFQYFTTPEMQKLFRSSKLKVILADERNDNAGRELKWLLFLAKK